MGIGSILDFLWQILLGKESLLATYALYGAIAAIPFATYGAMKLRERWLTFATALFVVFTMVADAIIDDVVRDRLFNRVPDGQPLVSVTRTELVVAIGIAALWVIVFVGNGVAAGVRGIVGLSVPTAVAVACALTLWSTHKPSGTVAEWVLYFDTLAVVAGVLTLGVWAFDLVSWLRKRQNQKGVPGVASVS